MTETEKNYIEECRIIEELDQHFHQCRERNETSDAIKYNSFAQEALEAFFGAQSC